ncbi:MAG: hypothetical protein EAZ06_06015 [Cytophagales bacterium]|nr:MAG: hypothetical protein EAZ06_06015 [Cytophagales bacterium]
MKKNAIILIIIFLLLVFFLYSYLSEQTIVYNENNINIKNTIKNTKWRSEKLIFDEDNSGNYYLVTHDTLKESSKEAITGTFLDFQDRNFFSYNGSWCGTDFCFKRIKGTYQFLDTNTIEMFVESTESCFNFSRKLNFKAGNFKVSFLGDSLFLKKIK